MKVHAFFLTEAYSLFLTAINTMTLVRKHEKLLTVTNTIFLTLRKNSKGMSLH